jgi:hypothetical protein
MNAMKHLIRRYRRLSERGQSLVEFALLAPVLIFLFMGMFDFGWLLHQQIQIDNAVRMGARRGAVGETTPNMINQMIGACTFPVTEGQITVDVRNPDGTSVGDNTDRTPDNLIYVAIDREDVQLITPLAGLLGDPTFDLHAESEFLIE